MLLVHCPPPPLLPPPSGWVGGVFGGVFGLRAWLFWQPIIDSALAYRFELNFDRSVSPPPPLSCLKIRLAACFVCVGCLILARGGIVFDVYGICFGT